MTTPDNKKQFVRRSIFDDSDEYICWNCEIGDISLNTAPPDLHPWFCSPSCAKEWWSQQSLANFLYKRALKRGSP